MKVCLIRSLSLRLSYFMSSADLSLMLKLWYVPLERMYLASSLYNKYIFMCLVEIHLCTF